MNAARLDRPPSLIGSFFDFYDRAVRVLVRIAELLTIILAFFITGAMILGVFFRFVLNSSIVWTDEVCSLLLAVVMFLVSGIGFHDRIHIAVVFLLDRLPPAGQRVLDVTLHAVSAAFFALVAVEGMKVAEVGMGMALATAPLPRGVFHLAIPIGGAFTVLVCLNNIANVVRGREKPQFGGVD
ncbi:MAG TPA: TRAP transporter small permease [Geminicoccaceae bacterium]|nr:TRAP transporter small permease [Geminicoccaceae bacterium]